MLKTQKSQEQILKLPAIYQKSMRKRNIETEGIDSKQNDILQVTKLEGWTASNRTTKKTKTMINTHNISFLYRNSAIRKQQLNEFGNTYKFMDVQLFIAKIDNELQKIGQLNYFSIYKNMQYCSGVYQNSFNTILKIVAKHKKVIKAQIDQIQLKLFFERQQHLKKVHDVQQNSNNQYKNQMNQVREILQEMQKTLKPLKRLQKSLENAQTKILKYCLSIGYDVRNQGLIWIIKELGQIPKMDEFPHFLSQKQINFIITKYMNEHQIKHSEVKMKNQICGKTIGQAYEFMNRRKRRQLSLIKQNQEIIKLQNTRIKDFSPEKHTYLSEDTLLIARSIEKQQPKPTRYEIIYKQAAKKLNKICKQKIHPQLYGGKQNKQSKIIKNQVKPSNEKYKNSFSQRHFTPSNESHNQVNQTDHIKQQKQQQQKRARKQKRNSTIIIEQFSKMLNLSINQTKKLEDLYSKEEKQFQQILRQIRLQKYSQSSSTVHNLGQISQISRSIGKLTHHNNEEAQLRNPISIIACLVGWKKAQKIIQQEMFGF